MAETIEHIVERVLTSGAAADEPVTVELRELWAAVVGSRLPAPDAQLGRDDATFEGLLAFIEAAHALDHGAGEQLQLRTGGWEIDASGVVVRAGLCAAVLTGILALAGVTALPPVVLPAVLPLLFNARRTTVSASHRELLAEIAPIPGVIGQPLTARELYERLPQEIKDEVSRLELVDFLAELHNAGLADEEGAAFVLRAPDRARLRITWK